MSDLDIDQLVADALRFSCNLNKSLFIDKLHGHILKKYLSIKGDLSKLH